MPLPDPRKLTAQRIARTEAYAAKIQRMFSQTVNELLSLPLSKADAGSGQMYSFDAETERTQRKVEQLLRRLQAAATLSIQKGVTLEWEQANQAADTILKSQLSKKALASPYMKGWNARNLEAMQQFLNRSDMGMNLSDRVWQSCRQLRDEMEVALTISIGEGEDAGTISRRVRQYLNDPDLMFRRFRYKDEDGRWQSKWKKRIKDPDRPGKYRFIDYDKDSYKDQWTGKGYYKSSAKNAMRVARTETNIAYRRADHERWQGLDFVLGQRVVLSRNHPEVDICDKLSAPNQREYDADDKRGLYPKDFVFDGWHPQCFCFVIPVMVAPEEMSKMNEAFVKGEDYTPKGEPITDYPKEFKDWCRDNASKIKASQQRGTEPYFVRNNAEVVKNIINPQAKQLTIAEKAKLRHDARTPERVASIQSRWNMKRIYDLAALYENYNLDEDGIRDEIWSAMDLVKEKGANQSALIIKLNAIKRHILRSPAKTKGLKQALIDRRIEYSLDFKVKSINIKTHIANAKKITDSEVISILKDFANQNPTLFNGGLSDVTFCKMSGRDMMANVRRYLADKYYSAMGNKIEIATNGHKINGKIFNPQKELKGALSAIIRGKELTFNQEYVLESLWHEIRHAQATGWACLSARTDIRRYSMETINQFCARHSYGAFVKALGGNPVNWDKIVSDGYGYSNMVNNLQTLLQKLGVPQSAAHRHFRNIIINTQYEDIHEEIIKYIKSNSALSYDDAEKLVEGLQECNSQYLEDLKKIFSKGGK